MFDNNFGKRGPTFKILSPDIREKILYVRTATISTLTATYCCATLLSSKIRKCCQIFTLNVAIIMFN